MANLNEVNATEKEINFDSIAAKLCGKQLSDAQEADIEMFNAQYDAAHMTKMQ